MDLLPHRYPFLLIDRVTDFELGVSIKAYKNITLTLFCKLLVLIHVASISWNSKSRLTTSNPPVFGPPSPPVIARVARPSPCRPSRCCHKSTGPACPSRGSWCHCCWPNGALLARCLGVWLSKQNFGLGDSNPGLLDETQRCCRYTTAHSCRMYSSRCRGAWCIKINEGCIVSEGVKIWSGIRLWLL